MPTGAHLAPVVEQPVADVLPDRMRAVELDRVEPLDLHRPEAAQALDTEELARDLAQAPLADGQPRLPAGARVAENGVPVRVG